MTYPPSGAALLFPTRTKTRPSRLPRRQTPSRSLIEVLEGRIAPSTLVTLTGSGVKILGDEGGHGEQETLELSATAEGLLIHDPLHEVSAGLGAVAIDAHTVLAPRASLQGALEVRTGVGSDSVAFEGAFPHFASVVVESDGVASTLTVHGELRATGGIDLAAATIVNDGKIVASAGSVSIHASGSFAQSPDGLISARSVHGNGGTISLTADGEGEDVWSTVSGKLLATGRTAGGRIEVTAPHLQLIGALVDASGGTAGGTILVGGDFHGEGTLAHAQFTGIDAATRLAADALQRGGGGSVVVWSDEATIFAGQARARAGRHGGDGGTLEISSKGSVAFTGFADASAAHGSAGSLLLDPKNITIDAAGASTAVTTLSFASQTGQTLTLSPAALTTTLNTGTAVTLQASNDITLNAAVLANDPGGNGGALSFQAGRSILLNAGITTDNGPLTLVANETAANGVIDADRDSGAAVITMASGAAIDTGTGALSIRIGTGAGLTNNASGDITLRQIISGALDLSNQGPTAGTAVSLLGSVTASGAVTVTSNNLGVSGSLNAGANSLTLKPATAGRAIDLGTKSTAALSMTATELAALSTGTLQIGDNASGAITVSTALTPAYHLSLTTGAGITFNQAVTMAANKSLTANAFGTASGTISLPNSTSDVAATGTGAISLTTARNISISNGASVTTVNGSLTLSANQQATPTSGSFAGVSIIAGGSVQTSGSGGLSVIGKGGDSGPNQYGVTSGGTIRGGTSGTALVQGTGGTGTGFFSYGVILSASGAAVTSAGANVQVIGQGSGGVGSGTNYGIYLTSGQITAGGSGSVTVQGTGGSVGSSNDGIQVSGATAMITSSGGNVSVTGFGGNAASGGSSRGVVLGNGGTISAGGSGSVTVQGTGGAGAGLANYGVYVSFLGGGGTITSGGGDVLVNGVGGIGSGGSNAGVAVASSGTITAAGLGSVTVQGSSNVVTGGNTGIQVGGGGLITSSGGSVRVEGTALGVGNFTTSAVWLTGGHITAGGLGSVSVTGTASGGNFGSTGILMTGTSAADASVITSGGGPVTVTANTVSSPPSSAGLLLGISGGTFATITTAVNGGNLTIVSNSVIMSADASISTAASGTTSVRPFTAGAAVSLGSADTASTLGLSVTELAQISTGTLQIGDSATGAISVNAALTPAYDLSLTTGAGIAFNQPVTMAANKNLTGNALGTINGTINGTISLPNSTSDLAASGTGAISLTTVRDISLAAGSSIITANGALTLSANQQASPTSGAFRGVDLTNATVRATGIGNVTVLGKGGDSSTGNQYGISLAGTAAIQGGTSGLAMVQGTGGPNGNLDYGVTISTNGADAISSSGANVLVIGQSGGTATATNRGVTVFSGQITAGGLGSVTVAGTATTGGPNQYGVVLSGNANSQGNITSSGGPISITGTSGSGGIGVVIGESSFPYGSVGTQSGGGNVTITTDTMLIGLNGFIKTPANGKVTIKPQTAGTSQILGTEAARIATGVLQLGDANTNFLSVTAASALTPTYDLVLNATGPVSLGGITMAAGKSLSATTASSISVLNTTAGVSTSGTGALAFTAARNVTLIGSVKVSTVDGPLTVSANQQSSPSAGNFVGLDLGASAALRVTGSGALSLSGTGGNDPAGGQSGIHLAAGSTISAGTTGTAIVRANGGFSTGDRNKGLWLEGGTITSTGASLDIQATGNGAGTAGNGYGVDIDAQGKIQTGGAGSLSLSGTGGNGGGPGNAGVIVHGVNALVSSNGGDVLVTGTGKGSGSSSGANGVQVSLGGTITAGGAGKVTVNGSGGNGALGPSNGVLILGVSGSPTQAAKITSAGGAVDITGAASSLTYSRGISLGYAFDDVNPGAITTATAGGNIVLHTDSFSLNSLSSITTPAAGSVTIKPLTAGVSIDLGGKDANGLLGLSSTELAGISTGTLQIGDAASGPLAVTAPLSISSNLHLVGGSGMSFQQSLTLVAGKNLAADAGGTISLLNDTSDFRVSGVGTLSLTTTRNITMGPGASISAGTGQVTLSANQQAVRTVGAFDGISIQGTSSFVPRLSVSHLSLLGRGGADPTQATRGIVIAHAVIDYANTIELTGVGGTSAGAGNDGIQLLSGANVYGTTAQLTGSGGGTGPNSGQNRGIYIDEGSAYGSTLVVNGTGGTGGGADNTGVYLTGAAQLDGDGLSVTGTGGANGSSNSVGVEIVNGVIGSYSGASVTVTGTGGGGSGSVGVALRADAASITASQLGTLNVNGFGGSTPGASGNVGVLVQLGFIGSQHGATSVQSVFVNGIGGQTGGGQNNHGVEIAGGTIFGSDNLGLTGTGGGGGAGGSNHGVYVHDHGTVQTSIYDEVIVTATGGGGGAGSNHGFYMTGTSALPSLVEGGSLMLNATPGAGPGSFGVRLGDAAAPFATLSAVDTFGQLNLHTDSMDLAGSATVSNPTNVLIAPKTPGRAIDLGGSDGPGALGLTAGELARISAYRLTLGESSTGPIRVSAAIDLPSLGLTLQSGAGLEIDDLISLPTFSATAAGGIDLPNPLSRIVTRYGRITLTSGGTIHLGEGATIDSGGDIKLTAADLDLAASSSIRTPINTGPIAVVPATSGLGFNVGGGGDATNIGLTAAELSVFTTTTLQIGDATTGAITIKAPVTINNNLVLTTGAHDIAFAAGGSLNVPGKYVILTTDPAGGIVGTGSGTHLTSFALTITAGRIGTAGAPLQTEVAFLSTNTAGANGDQYLGGVSQRSVDPFNAGTGTVHLVSGIYRLDGSNRIADPTSLSVEGATLAFGNFSDTVHGLTLASGAVTGTSSGTLTSQTDFVLQSGTVSKALAGNVGLTKRGGGLVSLTGSNTYSGLTTVEAGILQISNSQALGARFTGTAVWDGATLQLAGKASLGETLTLAGFGAPGTAGALDAVAGSSWTISPQITLAQSAAIGVGVGASLTDSGGFAAAAGTDASLTLNLASGGIAILNGSAGPLTPAIGSFTSVGNGTLRLNSWLNTGPGGVDIETPLFIGSSVTINSAGDVRFGSTVDSLIFSSHLDLRPDGDVYFGGSVGATHQLLYVSFSSGTRGITLAAPAFSTLFAEIFPAPVTLAADVTITTNSVLTFSAEVRAGGHNLTLNAFEIDANAAVTAVNELNLASAGSAAFHGPLTANTLTTSPTLGNVALTGGATIANRVTFLNTGSLTLGDDAADVLTFTRGFSSNDPAGHPSLTQLGGTVQSADRPLELGPVVLLADTKLEAGAAAITFGGTIDGAFALQTHAQGITRFNGTIGATAPLSTLTAAGGKISLGGDVTTTGSQSLTGDVTVAAPSFLSGAAVQFSGALTLSRDLTIYSTASVAINGPVDGFGSLTIDAAVDASLYRIGSAMPLPSLSVTAATTHLSGNVTTTGDQAFHGAVLLEGDVTLKSTDGSITLDTLDAGTVPARASFSAKSGAVTLGAVGVQAPLSGLSIIVGNSPLVLPVLHVAGDLSVTTAGGAISQSGILQIDRAASFDAGAGPILLPNFQNAFHGDLQLHNTGRNSVTINAVSDLRLAGVSVGTGELQLSAGGVLSQTAPVVQASGAAAAVLDGHGVALPLANAFTGDVFANVGGDLTLNNDGDLHVVDLFVRKGVTTLSSTHGTIAQNGGVILSPTIHATATAGLALNVDGPATVTALNSSSGDIVITAPSLLSLANVRNEAPGGAISMSAGSTLSNTGPITTTTGAISLSGGDRLVLGDLISTGTGDISLQARRTIEVGHSHVITATGQVTLRADADSNGTGSITCDLGSVSGVQVSATAAEGIALKTQAQVFSATNTKSGAISIVQQGDLALDTVTNLGRPVSIQVTAGPLGGQPALRDHNGLATNVRGSHITLAAPGGVFLHDDLQPLGDFDGDGRPDLALLHGGKVDLHLTHGDLTGFALTGVLKPSAPATALVAGDFDADGRDDLAVFSASTHHVVIYPGNGNGGFKQPVSFAAGAAVGSLVAGDFNNDGKLDLALREDKAVIVLLNQTATGGTVSLSSPVRQSTGTNPTADLATGDFDADGNLDLAVLTRSKTAAAVATLEGSGTGSFTAHKAVSIWPFVNHLQTGDITGDGLLDVAYLLPAAHAAGILPGDGHGGLGAPEIHSLQGAPTVLALGRFRDTPGSSSSLADVVTVYGRIANLTFNHGNNALEPGKAFPSRIAATAVTLADVNVDGQLDAILSNNQGAFEILYGTGVALTHTA